MVFEILAPLSGVIWGAFGYGVKHNKENFEVGKFFKTVGIGLILYGVAYVVGVDVTTAENFTLLQLGTILVDKIAGAIHTK